jgi:hypothetical protein
LDDFDSSPSRRFVFLLSIFPNSLIGRSHCHLPPHMRLAFPPMQCKAPWAAEFPSGVSRRLPVLIYDFFLFFFFPFLSFSIYLSPPSLLLYKIFYCLLAHKMNLHIRWNRYKTWHGFIG